MNAETSLNPDTPSSENSFAKMSEEVGAFDRNKNFLNKWYGFNQVKLKNIDDAPIDTDALVQTDINDELSSREEWEKQFINPYAFGIYASTAEIGDLVNQFAEDKDGIGIDKSINGTVKLFSEIYGLENDIRIEPLPKTEETANTWGLYMPGSNTFWFNFEKASSEHGNDAKALASKMISTVAHELWHAHQDDFSKKSGTLRGLLYETNFKNYKSPKESYHGYRSQLIEDEAHIMGTTVDAALNAFFRDEEAFTSDKAFCEQAKEQTLESLRKHEEKLASQNL
ncbi:hypothetical protein IKT64_02185 [Candidatus Saccharibacteria bacterium]|nr:hypothetical protein [Candidatus Saccharibacteria bacterium]